MPATHCTRHSKTSSVKPVELEVQEEEEPELEGVAQKKRPRSSSAGVDAAKDAEPYKHSRTGAWSPDTIKDVLIEEQYVNSRLFAPPSEYSQDRWLWNLTLLKAYAWRPGSKIFKPLPEAPFRRSTPGTLMPHNMAVVVHATWLTTLITPV